MRLSHLNSPDTVLEKSKPGSLSIHIVRTALSPRPCGSVKGAINTG